MAMNGLIYADVPFSNYSLTHFELLMVRPSEIGPMQALGL